VQRSAWHDQIWLDSCTPFATAVRASEATGAAPVKLELGRQLQQDEQLYVIVAAVLLAVALNRPFRAVVGPGFGAGLLDPREAEWRLPGDVESKRADGEHLVLSNSSDMFATAAAAGHGVTLLLDESFAYGWSCNVRHAEASLGVQLVLIPLAMALAKFGWDDVQVPLTRSLATTCAVQTFLRPAPEIIAEIDQRLEEAADVDGPGLLLAVHVGNGPAAAAAALVHARLDCAWDMTESFRLNAKLLAVHGGRGHSGREVGWVLAGGDKATVAMAKEYIASKAAGTPGVPHPTIIVADRNGTHAAAWIEFFLIAESHACTSYRGSCEPARTACIAGPRRQQGHGLLLEAVESTTVSDGSEPSCKRWSKLVAKVSARASRREGG
jgi:hypothetical protein